MAKVLLIEDDPLVVKMYRNVLSFEGFKIETAPNGAEGLKKASEFTPDLIFLDIMMPKMNGIEVLEKLKSDPETKDIPVIMLTNLAGADNAEEALKKGAFAYMVKSEYKPQEVAQKAKEFFGKKPATAGSAQTTQQSAGSTSPQVTQVQKNSQAVTQSKVDEVKLEPPTSEVKKPPISDTQVKSQEGLRSTSENKADTTTSSGSTISSSATTSLGVGEELETPVTASKTKPGGAVQSPPPPAPEGTKKDSGVPKPKIDQAKSDTSTQATQSKAEPSSQSTSSFEKKSTPEGKKDLGKTEAVQVGSGRLQTKAPTAKVSSTSTTDKTSSQSKSTVSSTSASPASSATSAPAAVSSKPPNSASPTAGSKSSMQSQNSKSANTTPTPMPNDSAPAFKKDKT